MIDDIENARKEIARRFIELLQPVIDDPLNHNVDPQVFSQRVEELKIEFAKETGYIVNKFYIYPVANGIYEIAIVFESEVQQAVEA